MKDIYKFLEHNVDLYNCGEHDMDNSYLAGSEGLVEEFARWQSSHEDCTPIGICKENVHTIPGMRYYAMVFEDDRGCRYYTHIPGYWIDEYKVFAKGGKAMKAARDKLYKQWAKEDYEKKKKSGGQKRDPYLCDALDTGGVKEALGIPNEDHPDYKPPSPPPEPEPEPKHDPEVNTGPTKSEKICFLCDALHTLENAHAYLYEAGEIGTAFGLRYIHGALQQIAARAIELDDPQLHITMLKLQLYDVENPREAIKKIEEKMKEKNGG